MDSHVTAVLDIYHQRLDEERAARPHRMTDPSWRDTSLLAVGPDTGQLINILARSRKAPRILEIGTSFGYSGIWLAEAARAAGGHVTTLEIAAHKSVYAAEMAAKAGLSDHITFEVGDALELIAALPGGWDFVLLDLWKDLYTPCLEAFYPKLNPGAIVVADNMIRPGGENLERYARAVRSKPGMASLLLPVGTGLEISRLEDAAAEPQAGSGLSDYTPVPIRN